MTAMASHDQSRTSSTTHLLSSRPQSYAPSISSVMSSASTLTPEAHTYRGFSSREAYLAALNEFAESKMYQEADNYSLSGFYGTKTMDEYKKVPGLREERRRRKEAERKARERESGRRATLGTVHEVDAGTDARNGRTEAIETSQSDLRESKPSEELKEGRMRRLSKVLTGGRRSSVS